jgi:hypothetical protein
LKLRQKLSSCAVVFASAAQEIKNAAQGAEINLFKSVGPFPLYRIAKRFISIYKVFLKENL